MNDRHNIYRLTLKRKVINAIKGVVPKGMLWGYRKISQKESVSGFLSENIHLRRFKIGAYSYGSLRIVNDISGSIEIGNYCSFARGATVSLSGEHATDWVTTFHGFFAIDSDFRSMSRHLTQTKGEIRIGSDVWVGNDAVIMSGVTIGNGAVVGANSIVRRDIPPYGIVMGNPARVIGYRFSPDQISELQHIAWWEWDLDKIKKAYPLLTSDNIDRFIQEYSIMKNDDA